MNELILNDGELGIGNLTNAQAWELGVIWNSLSLNTRRAYKKALQIARLNGLQFPLSSIDAVSWIDRLATGNYDTGNRSIKSRALKVNSIKSYLAALSFFQERILQGASFNTSLVKARLKTLSRDTAKRGLRQAKPLLTTDIEKLLSTNSSIKSIRDNALILLGFNGCLRRSELVGITFENLVWHTDGVEIQLFATKTAIRDSVAIPRNNGGYGALVKLINLLRDNGINSGFIFLPIEGTTKRFIRNRGLSVQSVNLILKRACTDAGIDSILVSGHSLRSGCASSMSILNVNVTDIARHGRWSSMNTVIRYCRAADQFTHNPLNAFNRIRMGQPINT